MQVTAEITMDQPDIASGDSSFSEQIEALYRMIERLEDAVAGAVTRENEWHKEKKQLLDSRSKLEKKLSSANEDIKFIKEHLDQAKKEKEQFAAQAKKERERFISAAKQEQETLQSELKELKLKNQKLATNMEKVTAKLDQAIIKIGELIEE